MRLNTSTPSLLAVSSLFCFGSSLPFFSRPSHVLVPLVRRATYSVVPVDGGPAATDDAQPAATIVQTIVQTQAPVTIVETDTNVVISTKIIEGAKTAKTILVTVTQTPPATTATATKYSVIDVDASTVTVVVPAAVPSSSSSSVSIPPPALTSSSSTTSSTSASTAASSSVPIPSAPASSLSTASTFTAVESTSSNPTLSSSTSSSNPATVTTVASSATSLSASILISTSISEAAQTNHSPSSTSVLSTLSTSTTETSILASSTAIPTSRPAFDNGQWHTYYPSWSNATGTATSGSSPTLTPRRLDGATAESALAARGIVHALRQNLS